MYKANPSFIIKLLFGIFAVVFTAVMGHQLFTFPYIESGDGQSLFNPVYMGKFYHRIVYPAYYYFDNMPVHPPVYYSFMSLLYAAGLPVFYVVKAPLFAAIAAFVAAVVLSRLSYGAKFTALLAIAVAIERAGAFITFRPDIVLSLLFLTSLVCLHEGTRTYPKIVWLLVGSVLIGLSSTLHYFGIMGVAGLLFFGKKIIDQLGWKQARTTLLYLFLPGSFIVGSYLLFIILPNAKDVLHEVTGTKVGFNTSAIEVHYQMYNDVFGNRPAHFLLMLLPVAGWLLIAACFNKEMRTLYLASLPFILFVFLVASGKSAGYYIVEFALFFWMLNDFILRIIRKIVHRFPSAIRNGVSAVVFFYIAFIACTDYKLDRHVFEVGTNDTANGCEMFTARACAKQILGSDAKVGGRLNLWFCTGAAHWYRIDSDIFPTQYGENKNVSHVFKQLDAIAEYRHFADKGSRKDKYTLSSWYEDDTLHLKGFYITNNYKAVPYNLDVDGPYLLFSADQADTVKGYMVNNNEQIYSFITDSVQPDNYFVSLIISDSTMRYPLLDSTFEMYTRYIYPNTKGAGDNWLIWGLAKKIDVELLVRQYQSYAHIKDLVPLRKKAVAKSELLRYTDAPIKFYKDLESLKTGQPYY